MRYSELIRELNYWKEILEEENPEIVIYSSEYEFPIEIDQIVPKEGIDNKIAIGITYYG